jgi:carbon dioxide concentrating mechanism protein CcmO
MSLTPIQPSRSLAHRYSEPRLPEPLLPETRLEVQPQPRDEGALGLICTRSFPAIVGTADMMLKASGVTLVGYEKTGSGFCTAVVRGGYADVKIAVETGVDVAKQFGQYVSSLMLPRPLPNLNQVLPISTRFASYASGGAHFRSVGAIGLIETRGFPAMVGASDAMLKCANVELITYETTGDGLCTAVVQGPVADVTMAVEAGMNAAERIGELHAIMVIPRPLDDLMRAMPTPKSLQAPLQAMEKRQSVRVEEKRETLQPLPELQRLPEPVREPIAEPVAESLDEPLGELLGEPIAQPERLEYKKAQIEES